MTVYELMKQLSRYHDDAEVRLATQQHYPLEYTVQSVASLRECQEAQLDNLTGDEVEVAMESIVQEDSEDNHVYIYEGTQVGYLKHPVDFGW